MTTAPHVTTAPVASTAPTRAQVSPVAYALLVVDPTDETHGGHWESVEVQQYGRDLRWFRTEPDEQEGLGTGDIETVLVFHSSTAYGRWFPGRTYHRVDGPAFIVGAGDCTPSIGWLHNGRDHRLDGPDFVNAGIGEITWSVAEDVVVSLQGPPQGTLCRHH